MPPPWPKPFARRTERTKPCIHRKHRQQTPEGFRSARTHAKRQKNAGGPPHTRQRLFGRGRWGKWGGQLTKKNKIIKGRAFARRENAPLPICGGPCPTRSGNGSRPHNKKKPKRRNEGSRNALPIISFVSRPCFSQEDKTFQ